MLEVFILYILMIYSLNVSRSRKTILWLFLLTIIFIFLHVYFLKFTSSILNNVRKIMVISQSRKFAYKNDTKYVLIWKSTYLINQDKFSSQECSNRNCFFTKYRGFLSDYTQFDAIIFDENILDAKSVKPSRRSPKQLYVFNALESSYNKPSCNTHDDGFFNWTLTYRIDSDIMWSYFVVRNLTGAIIAPSVSVEWQRNSKPVPQNIKSILGQKSKAAAWLVSHCRADSFRDEYLTRLQEHLFHFKLKIDVYGSCSQNKCPNDNCDSMLKQYFFYMAFENSFSEDYVTEKVMHGYDNYAVPIVYGGANYSRFLPVGSYINAREMHPYNLAFVMYKAIKDPKLYETYFKWTNLYTVDSNFGPNHPLCTFCEALHTKSRYVPAKEKFRVWWNDINGMKWCLSEEFWNETALFNIDGSHIFQLY